MIGANTEHMCVSQLDRNPWSESTLVCGAVACDYISNFSSEENTGLRREGPSGSPVAAAKCAVGRPWRRLACSLSVLR